LADMCAANWVIALSRRRAGNLRMFDAR
jgi:hypothetical protein